MATWTLEHEGTIQTLAEWGADDSSTLAFTSFEPGVLTLHFPGMLDADVPFSYKDKVILRRDDAVVFRGHAMAPRRTGEGISEGITVQFQDAWFFLNTGSITQNVFDSRVAVFSRSSTLTNGSYDVVVVSATGLSAGMSVTGTGIPALTYVTAIVGTTVTLNNAATISGTSALKFFVPRASTTVALFASITPGLPVLPMTPRTALAWILASCNRFHLGDKMQMGECYGAGFLITPQPVDVVGTFATALHEVLRYVPDAVPWFDYTTDPPTLNFTQRSAATAQTVSLGTGVLISQEIQARPDLLFTGVKITYSGYLLDGTPSRMIDQAGDASGPGVLTFELQLNPPTELPTYQQPVTEQQYIAVEAIDIEDPAWWVRNANINANPADVVVGEGSTLELDPDAPENADAEDLTDINGCSNQILEGSIPSWMNQSAHLRYVRATGYLTIRTYNDPDHTEKGYKLSKEVVQVDCTATDLVTNTYENTLVMGGYAGGTFDPEAMPTGIAVKLLAALGVLHYQGAITVTDEECDLTMIPGRVVNITGQRAEWAAMNAQIQGVSHQLHYGTTTFNFGPPNHMAAQDYLEMSRAFQRLKPSQNLDTRATGNIPGGDSSIPMKHPIAAIRSGVRRNAIVKESQDVDDSGSITTNTKNGAFESTDGTVTVKLAPNLKFLSLEGEGKSVTINLNDLPASGTVMFRSYTICVGGTQMTAKLLGTAPA
ncbi:hypothetical protein [Prosthecobacter vanneervenii]|uniref:Uncharacterized protein n=1 Tax=Prosthecobacter vanneervenii TaxID=48466 RepID=A0A7W7YBL5_9BACT|nr:hypothetical protein [Prosthecobacter vanneervenii]MBB5033178.1 hypothetical protein [Prosthecobacter vanneervenii]